MAAETGAGTGTEQAATGIPATHAARQTIVAPGIPTANADGPATAHHRPAPTRTSRRAAIAGRQRRR